MIAFIVGMTLLFFAQEPGPSGRVAGGVVTGRITSADGSAMAGIRVAAMTDGPTQLLSSLSVTDAAGNYRLEALPPRSYYIVAGPLDAPTFYPGRNRDGALMVTALPGGAITGVDFNYPWTCAAGGARVNGRLVGLAPALAPLLTVRLWYTAAPQCASGTVPVSPDGRFEFRDMPDGDYTMNLVIGETSRVTAMIRVDGFDLGGIEFAAPRVVPGHFELQGGGPLPTPMDAGSLGPSLQPWKRSSFGINFELRGIHSKGTCGECLFNAVSDSDGAFNLTLPVGEYDVFVNRLPLGYEVVSVTYGAVDVLKSPLKVAPQADLHDLRVTVAPVFSGVKVSGVIADVDLESIMPRWAILTTQIWDGLSPMLLNLASQAPIQKDGTFEFLHVPPGSATVEIAPAIPNLPSRTVQVTDRDVSGVELRPPSPPATLQRLPLAGDVLVRLPAGSCQSCTGRISGRLTGEAPLPTAIRLVVNGKVMFEAPVKAEGRFDFVGVPSLLYDVQVSLPILVPVRLPRLTTGTRIVELPIPQRRTIGGRVVLEGGNGAEDWKQMRVLVNGDANVPIQSNGSFSLPLAEGGYTLSVTNLPDRYDVKSITYGKADLLRTPLPVYAPPTAEVVITLANRR